MPRKTAPPPDDDQPTDGEAAATKSARTRQRLLDSAAAVLARKGFAGTRLSDIAAQAQVQAPAIYYYYPSREDLIEEVMTTGASAIRNNLEKTLAELPDGTPPAARIAAAVEAHLRLELEISDYAKAITRNANQLPPSLSKRAKAEVTAYYELWRGLIEDLAAAQQLREDVDPSVGRMIVLGALNWTAEWWRPERGSLEDVIRTTQSMVLHALRP
ncbi:TetR/AcrR family transcriptional regulator [Pseudonocardia hispaniensis]|uniref:TetR/AcrR family transcriptional regulator n=1 Tax=Pseudonocardia hispaniensis TaxID=904933 RepID=A0ABW1J2U6_9PSEU